MVSLIVEKSWTKVGKCLKLCFDVPVIGASWFVACYLHYPGGRKLVPPRVLRREMRSAAREWAEYRIKQHGCR